MILLIFYTSRTIFIYNDKIILINSIKNNSIIVFIYRTLDCTAASPLSSHSCFVNCSKIHK